MMRPARSTLVAGALLILSACQSDNPTTSPIPLQASFSDGAHHGNPDFFFLPPIFKNPNSDPAYEPGAFNPNVRPTVEICELGTAVPRVCIAGDPIRRFTAGEIQRSVTDQQYLVNWNTKESNLNVGKEYRIRVLVGAKQLGWVDVDPVSTGSQLKNVETGQYIGLVDDRTLPIKFRIENAAVCDGADPCDSKTIDLSQDNTIVLQATGDRVDIPAQTSGQIVTVTVDLCDGLNIDLPVFGNCLRVRSDPPLAARLSPRATVSMCSLRSITIPLPHPQQELLTLHRQDDEAIIALPHSGDYCPSPIGQMDAAPSRNVFAGVWRAVRRAAASMLPQPLHATTVVLDVGQGGETDGFSDFQFALPAKMDFGSLVDQVANPLSAVGSPPTAVVTDAVGNPVPGARVHFEITAEDGSSITPTDGVVQSDATTGKATLTEWRLGRAGRYSVRAFGRGIADPEHNGPGAGFDPFAPAVLHDRDQDLAQPPVSVGSGTLDFTATAGAVDFMIHDLVFSPSNPTTDDAVTVSVSVTDAGSAGAPPATVNLCIAEVFRDEGNTTSCKQSRTPSLASGGSTTLTATFDALAVGTYMAFANVDQLNSVPESDENNNATQSSQFDVIPNTITFETLPNGEPTCGQCEVTDQFGARRIEFAYEDFEHIFTGGTLADGINSLYGDPVDAGNHFVTAKLADAGGGVSGVLTMTLSPPYPHTVIFDWSTAPDVTPQINVFPDGEGRPLPEASFNRTFLRSYLNNVGEPFVWRRVTVTSEVPIQRLVFIMQDFIQLIDNVQLIR